MKCKFGAAVTFLLSAITVQAQAVPAWTTSSGHFDADPVYCRGIAEKAIQSVTGSPAAKPPTETYSATGSVTAGFSGGAGISVYCIAHPQQVCKGPSSTIAVIVFSDKSSDEVVAIRDQIFKAIGNPTPTDCG